MDYECIKKNFDEILSQNKKSLILINELKKENEILKNSLEKKRNIENE